MTRLEPRDTGFRELKLVDRSINQALARLLAQVTHNAIKEPTQYASQKCRRYWREHTATYPRSM